MDTIAAIQTTYKGYRFRSRLEARWAIFFDRVGMRWDYEVEPVLVNGEAYLPDFKLYPPDVRKPVYVEIKPAGPHPLLFPGVYLAGKCSEEHDWRGPIGDEYLQGGDHSRVRHPFMTMANASFVKCGPFIENFHGQRVGGPHSADQIKLDIVNQCHSSVINSDIFCAHISTPDAFGTLIEIGIATAMGIPTSLSFTKDVLRACQYAGHTDYANHDLWFAELTVSRMKGNLVGSVTDAAEAQAFHADFIRKNTPREIRLITGIAAQHGPCCIVFGDPVDVAEEDHCLWHQYDFTKLTRTNKGHASTARGHRFDRH